MAASKLATTVSPLSPLSPAANCRHLDAKPRSLASLTTICRDARGLEIVLETETGREYVALECLYRVDRKKPDETGHTHTHTHVVREKKRTKGWNEGVADTRCFKYTEKLFEKSGDRIEGEGEREREKGQE